MRIITGSVFILMMCACMQNTGSVNRDVPGKLYIKCNEAIVDGKPDTVVHRRVIGDSIEFKTQKYANCCGWYEQLVLAKVNDTIKMYDLNTSEIRNACDCNCIFDMSVTFPKAFFDTSNNVIMFSGKQIK